MYDLYLRQEEELGITSENVKWIEDNLKHHKVWRTEGQKARVQIFSMGVMAHMLDVFNAQRKSHLVALLDKAIEELECEKYRVNVTNGTYSTSMYVENEGKKVCFNKGLSTAISHLTNLRDKLLEK